MDMGKLKTLEASGNFSNSENGAEKYKQWSGWASLIRLRIRTLNKAYEIKSSMPKVEEFKDILLACNKNPESAVHVIISDMTQNGTTWVHLMTLRKLVPERQIRPELAGKFYLQIADWLTWFSLKEEETEKLSNTPE